MAERFPVEDFLEDETKQTQSPLEEVYRAVYRRRGSDLVIAATKTNQVQVTRVNHRFKVSKHFVHDPAAIESKKDEIKKMLEDGKYQLVERTNVSGVTG